MSELPREAKALLALAKDAHAPPDEAARERVRRGVALAVAAGAGSLLASQTAAAAAVGKGVVKTGLFASATAKLATATAGLVVIGVSAVAVPRFAADPDQARARPAQKAAPVAAPHALHTQPSSPEVVATSALEEATTGDEPGTPPAATPTAPRRAETIGAEMRLLRLAADALAANDARRALGLLRQHERRFAQPLMAEEADGLRALARCMIEPDDATAAATAYVARAPHSVLAGRIGRACRMSEPR